MGTPQLRSGGSTLGPAAGAAPAAPERCPRSDTGRDRFRLRPVGRPNFVFAGACAFALAAATVVVAAAEDLPIRDPDGVVVPTYVRLPIILLLAWLIDVVPRAVLQSRGGEARFLGAVREVVRERWNRRHVVFAVSGLGTWYVCYAAFRNLKSYVPFVNGRIWDDELEWLDNALWLGHHPAETLHTIFGTTVSAEFFSFIYVSWIVLIPVSLAIALVWTRHPAAGSWYVTAIALDWLLGVAAYYALPTLGPAYSEPDDFSHLDRTFTTTLVEDLWSDRLAVVPELGGDPHTTNAVQTIAAFPSLHVGIMMTICLFLVLIGAARWVRVTAWVYLGLTVLATIYFGWHFSLDAVGGAAVGALAVWLAALGTGNHSGWWPRLVDRGSLEEPDQAVQPSTAASRPA